MKRILVSAAVVVLAVAALGGCGGSNSSADSSTSTSSVVLAESGANESSSTFRQYSSLRGDDFDKAYLADMIVHHQGAIDMAKSAQQFAKHDEIRTLANNIVATQQAEIDQMRTWQPQFSYAVTTASDMEHMGHTGDTGAMMGQMMEMSDKLNGKTGDSFDRMFLSMMIDHHQSAVDMSVPAAANAKHQEVKSLAANVVAAQTKEIADMKQWQRSWGYTS